MNGYGYSQPRYYATFAEALKVVTSLNEGGRYAIGRDLTLGYHLVRVRP